MEKFYTIQEVSSMTGIPSSTLRYYDKEGLLPFLTRSARGYRLFSERDLTTLQLLECLKSTGMSIREMKQYLTEGTIPEISRHEKMALLRRQIDESISRIDEYRGILHTRRHLAATPLLKGIRNFRDTRIAMLRADTKAELTAILDHIENEIFPTLD